MAIPRQDVATLGPGWNKTLLNFARAMGELDKLPITNRNSWKFLAAIHGFDQQQWVDQEIIRSTDPIPADLIDNTYANQCQHGSWYFASWHRGYLFAFEEIVAAKIKQLTGDDWALPYWNYLNASDATARRVPEAFLEERLPDGTPNPLRRYPRNPGMTELRPGPGQLDLDAMRESDFLVGNDGSIGFGGGVSGFQQFNNRAGDLERDPHNVVHVMVGGFMGDPITAGLDPLFWLHHCNIDRLWEAWMRTPRKTMVSDPLWLNGPAERSFIMPTLGGVGAGRKFTSKDTLPGGTLHRDYDDLTKGTGVTPGAEMPNAISMGSSYQQRVEPIGANAAAVRVGAAPAPTIVALEPAAAADGVSSMGAKTTGEKVTRIYLTLEAVRGDLPSPVLDVYVNLPNGATPGAHPERLAGSITLFGLKVASNPAGPHAGNGLGFTLDITDLIQRLSDAGEFAVNAIQVTLVPRQQITEAKPVTIQSVKVLKRTGVVG
jgi:tyrosinase